MNSKYKIPESLLEKTIVSGLVLLAIGNIVILKAMLQGVITMGDKTIVIAIIGLVLVGFIIILYAYFLTKATKEFKKYRFRKFFRQMVIKSQPNWQEVQEFGQEYDLSKTDVIKAVKKSYIKILTGKDDVLLKHKELLSYYKDRYNEEEPFDGITANMHTYLVLIRENNNINQNTELLANDIKSILTFNDRKMQHQRMYTAAGFIFGLAGFILTAYKFF